MPDAAAAPSNAHPDPPGVTEGRQLGLGAPAIGVGLLALAVNSVLIGRPGPWRDEAASWVSLDRSVEDLFSLLTRVDLVHGSYYLLLRPWTLAFGDSVLSLRWSSVMSIAVAAGLLVLLAGRLFGRSAGIWAGVVFSLLPQATWAATEARSYALSCVAVIGVMLAFFRASESPSVQRWLTYSVIAAAAVHVFLYSFTVLVILAIGALAMRPSVRRPALLATAGAAVACAPLIVFAAGQRQQVSWLAKYRPTLLGTTLEVMWGVNPWAQVGGAAAILALIVLTIMVVRREPSLRTSLAVTWSWLLVPSGLLLVAGAWLPLYHPRYVTMSAPALAILLGVLISRASGILMRGVALAVVLAICAPQFIASREQLSKSTPVVAVNYVLERAHKGDCLYVPGKDVNALQWAFPALAGLRNIGHPPPEWRKTSLYEPAVSIEKLGERLNHTDRLWVIADGGRTDDALLPALAARGYRVVEDVRLTDAYRTRVVLFEPRAGA